MYDEILVPTDGGPTSQAAIGHAVSLARQYDARLHALYVVDSTAYATLEAGAEAVLRALQQEGEAATEEVTRAAQDAGVSARTEILTGSPPRMITDYATDHDIDLIVMATHGRTGLDRYLLGSVTERVVRTAEVPVLTVRAPEE